MFIGVSGRAPGEPLDCDVAKLHEAHNATISFLLGSAAMMGNFSKYEELAYPLVLQAGLEGSLRREDLSDPYWNVTIDWANVRSPEGMIGEVGIYKREARFQGVLVSLPEQDELFLVRDTSLGELTVLSDDKEDLKFPPVTYRTSRKERAKFTKFLRGAKVISKPI